MSNTQISQFQFLLLTIWHTITYPWFCKGKVPLLFHWSRMIVLLMICCFIFSLLVIFLYGNLYLVRILHLWWEFISDSDMSLVYHWLKCLHLPELVLLIRKVRTNTLTQKLFKTFNITIRIVHCSQRIGAKNPLAATSVTHILIHGKIPLWPHSHLATTT